MIGRQSRLLLLPGLVDLPRRNGGAVVVAVYIVDRSAHMNYATCTVVLRESLPEDVTWGGSRLPGGIGEVDEEDVRVDLAAVEAEQ